MFSMLSLFCQTMPGFRVTQISYPYIQVVPACLNLVFLKVHRFLPKGTGRLTNSWLIPAFMPSLPKTQIIISRSLRFSNHRMKILFCTTTMNDVKNPQGTFLDYVYKRLQSRIPQRINTLSNVLVVTVWASVYLSKIYEPAIVLGHFSLDVSNIIWFIIEHVVFFYLLTNNVSVGNYCNHLFVSYGNLSFMAFVTKCQRWTLNSWKYIIETGYPGGRVWVRER